MNRHIKLKEIIWEITGRCENNCSYCGSKDSWANNWNDETEDKMIEIAENIAKYPPEQIDISGGDPLLISYVTHKAIVNILKDNNVICKILINPKSLIKGNSPKEKIDLYDWIGLSINTEQELKLIYDLESANFSPLPIKSTTVISNFNLQNIFLYEKIEEFVRRHNLAWQIQYTIFKREKNLALYENPAALEYFFKKVQLSLENGIKIMPADNMNNGSCGAGLNSIGILYNGDIVPCLSMRSWVDNINDVVVGNILHSLSENPLKYTWENKFNAYRFCEFKCCKDFCKNKAFQFNQEHPFLKLKKESEKGNEKELEDFPRSDPLDKEPNIVMYGVSPKTPQIVLYGVSPAPYSVRMYAVIKDPQEGTYVYACPSPLQWTGSSVKSNETQYENKK